MTYFLLVENMNVEQRQEIDEILSSDQRASDKSVRMALLSQLPGGEVVASE